MSTSSGSRVRRDGTIATSSNPYARRAIFPLPISISMLVLLAPAHRPGYAAAPTRSGWTPSLHAGKVPRPCRQTGLHEPAERSRLRRDDNVHLTVTPARAWPAVAEGPTRGPGSALADHVPRLVDPQVGQPRMQPVALDQDRVVLEVPELLELGQRPLQRSVGCLDHRVQHQLGALGDLVRIIDAREPLDLAGERLLVQAFGVAVLRQLVERGVHVDLDELPDHRPHLVAGLPVGRYRAADRGDPVAGQELGDETDPQHVRVAVVLGKPVDF